MPFLKRLAPTSRRALRGWNEALTLYNHSYLYNNRARTLIHLDRLEEAWDDLQMSLEMDPGNVVLFENLAFYFEQKGEPEAAQRCQQRKTELEDLFELT